ncbi:CAP domain-containing protein [Chitinilyticum piscinae]|uniref:CAP domain-containing protein n=1 Tax=Chitinilyticum piscinae TaxID=2866724 RepID=A0A8J7FXJ6_9NEIS|nr:CAP domain-containing protein [Chitinilyticum piscinae]MBE9608435.1 CAP domain-containing protein [Chitinilyticum piscinae]
MLRFCLAFFSCCLATLASADEIETLNIIRRETGIPVLQADPALTKAAQAHADYLAALPGAGHGESAGQTGFTGTTPTARCKAQGDSGGCWEVLYESASANPLAALRALLKGPLHRNVLLDPGMQRIGLGSARLADGSRTVVITTGKTSLPRKEALLAHWPLAAGPLQAFSPQFASHEENPSPLPDGVAKSGYILSLHANAVLEIGEWLLLDQQGKPVSSRQLPTQENNWAMLMPNQPLHPGTRYDVRFSGTLAGQPVTRNWSFQTLARVAATLGSATPGQSAQRLPGIGDQLTIDLDSLSGKISYAANCFHIERVDGARLSMTYTGELKYGPECWVRIDDDEYGNARQLIQLGPPGS